ncbi:MAG: PIN domain nuclease [Ignavibacteriaceae bacterium]|nr:PIN domain nuclease [Ignavibacteriaceae bacterium]
MILVDSSVLIDYLNGKENWQVEKLDAILGKEIVVIGDYILLEVLQGFKNDKDFEAAKNVLNIFPCFNMLGEEIAIECVNNYLILRKKGISIRKTIDVIISTFCIINDIQLLHNDKGFFPFEKHLGLQSVSLKSS